MHCPNPACQADHAKPELLMTERSGIEIDYCPRCRGIWLDRGELGRLLEKTSHDTAPPQQAPRSSGYGDRHDEHEKHKYDHDRNKNYDHKRRKSLLSELFDF